MWLYGSRLEKTSSRVLTGCTLHSQWFYCLCAKTESLLVVSYIPVPSGWLKAEGCMLLPFLKCEASHLVPVSPHIVCALAACNGLTFTAVFMSTSRRGKTESKLNFCVYLLRLCMTSQLCVYNLSLPLDKSVFLVGLRRCSALMWFSISRHVPSLAGITASKISFAILCNNYCYNFSICSSPFIV